MRIWILILGLKGSKGSTHLNGLASPAKVKIILNIEYVIVDSSLVTRRDCQRDTLQLKAAFKQLWKISGKWCFRRTVGSLSWQQRKWREEGWVVWAVADPGEGPGGPAPLFLAQTEARRETTPPPPLSQGLNDRPPYLKVWIRHCWVHCNESVDLWQLMNEAEYLMKNHGDRGGCYPSRRITPSEISIILHMTRKPNLIIVLLFIQNNS